MMDKAETSKDSDAEPVQVRVLLVEQVKTRAKNFDGRERTYHIEQRIVAGGSCMALYAGVV